MMFFEHMAYLYWLWVIPFLVIGYVVHIKWQIHNQLSFGNPRLTKELLTGTPVYRKILKTSLKIIALILLIVALANPQQVSTQQLTASYQQHDVVLAIDISTSMLAEDVQPNRLLKTKSTALQMLNELKGASVGIVVFAGKAYAYLPLTADYAYVRNAIKSIHVDEELRQGTSLREALQVSALLFNGQGGNGRAICVLSDGESHGSDYKRTADSLRKADINLLSIGVGTTTGAPIPLIDKAGNRTFKKDQKGNVIISRLNSTSLQALVNNPANYFGLAEKPVDTKKLLAALYSSPYKTVGNIPTNKNYYELFLWMSAFMLLVDIMIPATNHKYFRSFKIPFNYKR